MISDENIKRQDKKETTSFSFRIDRGVTQKLQEKAGEENISLNGLINRVLKKYVEWDIYFQSKAGMVPISKPVVKEIFDNLNTEEVIRIATNVAKKAVYDTALFMKGGKMDPDIFLSWFLLRMQNCSEILKSPEEKGGTNTYVLKHDLGENWSLYHKTVVESIFLEILHKPIHISNTESTITLKI